MPEEFIFSFTIVLVTLSSTFFTWSESVAHVSCENTFLNYLENFINIDQNLTKVRHVATGFLLIQRTVFETMAREHPTTKYVDDVSFLRPEENQYAYALFECGVEEGHYFSEDWGFCSRWNKLNGDVWIDVSIQLNHTGIETFRGTYISSLI